MKILCGLGLALALTACESPEKGAFEQKRAEMAEISQQYSISQCLAQNGVSESYPSEADHNKVTCHLPDGSQTIYESEYGMFRVTNDANGLHAKCALRNAKWAKGANGEFQCVPNKPATKTKFVGSDA